jgi:hypothetical protein
MRRRCVLENVKGRNYSGDTRFSGSDIKLNLQKVLCENSRLSSSRRARWFRAVNMVACIQRCKAIGVAETMKLVILFVHHHNLEI